MTVGVCPGCGGPATQTERYPDALCAACAAGATDLAGRPVAFWNVSISGGFQATHRDDDSPCEQVTRDHRVVVDGVERTADEARFGGVVVQPLA